MSKHHRRIVDTMIALALILSVGTVWTDATAQPNENHSPLDRYLLGAHPYGTLSIDFPGPGGGYTFIHFPTEEVREWWGDTVVHDHTYLLDLNVSNDGLYLAPDTQSSFSRTTPFEFNFPGGHVIHADLTPGHTHEDLQRYDSTFNGTLGWGLFKKYITAFDFQKNQLTFYPLYSPDSVADDDTSVLQLPIIDDAQITYCHCNASTVWLDVEAPPLPAGHVNLAFQDPHSLLYRPSLDSVTRVTIDKDYIEDSLAGKPRSIGISIAQFTVHDLFGHAVNLAPRGPHRYIDHMPPIYHDFNVPVMGALGTDVIRTFRGLIIDPSRGKLIFIK